MHTLRPTLSRVHLLAGALAMATLCLPDNTSLAAPGEPVAIERIGDGFVIESMWNLSIQIVSGKWHSPASDGVDLLRTNGPLRNQIGTPAENDRRIQQDASPGAEFDFTLDRPANEETPQWKPTSEFATPSVNAIRVRAAGPVIVVDVDGVRISYLDGDLADVSDKVGQLTAQSDVLIVAPGANASDEKFAEIRRLVVSEVVVLAAPQSSSSAGNTLAVRAGDPERTETPRVVYLGNEPAGLPDELKQLMRAKELSCQASQEVFAKLSVTQMNFQPSNGSHTPRWNAEHMMGRELLFFSQIYAGQDAAIPVMDLNPKQMPPDYVAKHADWTGAEEARQMERVSAFTRRFAYLLKDLPLDQKLAGSNWVLRALLRQMDRHYSEHTANVIKKFDLEDWPQQ